MITICDELRVKYPDEDIKNIDIADANIIKNISDIEVHNSVIQIHEKNKLVVVVDLDDTLVHSVFNNHTCTLDIYVRKGVKELFDFIKNNNIYLIIWSHGKNYYVKICIYVLDPTNTYINQAISTKNDTSMVKDISELNKCIDNILLIDNNILCGIEHCKHYIKVPDYINIVKQDNCLFILIDILYEVLEYYYNTEQINDVLSMCNNILFGYHYCVEKKQLIRYYEVDCY